MRWFSHIAIAASVCAVFDPGAVPAAVLGSTAPDWIEFAQRAATGRRVKHRGPTHYLVAWVALALFALLLWDWRGLLLWFAVGGALHWFCDALTVSGAPVGWWSDRRVTLFGGKVQTGHPSEYLVTAVVVFGCALVVWQRHRTGADGFLPFFYDWAGLYKSGLIDGLEWRTNRFRLF